VPLASLVGLQAFRLLLELVTRLFEHLRDAAGPSALIA